MPILEQTVDRVRLSYRSSDRRRMIACLDRNRDRIVTYSLVLFLPIRHETSTLSAITAVQVFKNDHEEGPPAYGVVLRRQNGGKIRFDCSSRDEAMSFLRVLAKFLKLDH